MCMQMGVDTPGKETSSMWEIYAVSPRGSDIEEAICWKFSVWYVHVCECMRVCQRDREEETKYIYVMQNQCWDLLPEIKQH